LAPPVDGQQQSRELAVGVANDRRRVERSELVLVRDLDGFLAESGREVDEVVNAGALAVERRGLGGKAGWATSFRRHIGLRYRTSSIGQTGCPVTRSNKNVNACLVICATALIFLPLTVMSARIGGAPMSQSQTS
jgi:hypothetical protein